MDWEQRTIGGAAHSRRLKRRGNLIRSRSPNPAPPLFGAISLRRTPNSSVCLTRIRHRERACFSARNHLCLICGDATHWPRMKHRFAQMAGDCGFPLNCRKTRRECPYLRPQCVTEVAKAPSKIFARCGVPSQIHRPFQWFAGPNPWVCTHG
jgi:hypothetical protein